jgi:endonuclease/exonuclease/phosphatase family metal-dependent hydrolase
VRLSSLAFLACLGTLGACDLVNEARDPDAAADPTGDAVPDGFPPPQTDVVPAVGSSATLDIACWNLENFPAIAATPALVADLITSLDLDLIVVEEIADVAAFDELIARLPEHEAVLSSHRYTPTSYQKIGLIYRTPLVQIGAHELIFTLDDYAFPRPALKVPVTVGSLTFDVIGLHLKAGGDPSDYERRTAAARSIDAYLRAQVDGGGEDDVVVLGDYNEVIDTPTGQGVLGPLLVSDRYRFRSDAAVAAGERSFLHGSRVIDHILTTAGLSTEIGAAVAVIPHLDVQYPNYEPIVSDHLPVILSIPMPPP